MIEAAIGDIAGSYGTDTFSLGDRQVSNVTLISVDEARTWLFDTKDQDVVGILPLGHGVGSHDLEFVCMRSADQRASDFFVTIRL